jgi:hypothetical protein
MKKLYAYEILEAIANAGHTYSPEADGRYIMRNCDVRDVVATLSKFLLQHGVEVSDITRIERYWIEGGGRVDA